MEFEHRRGMNGCCVTDDIRNHASLCIKMINDLLQKLQNAEGFMYHTETKNTDRKGTTFSDADIKSKNPYIHSANKIMGILDKVSKNIQKADAEYKDMQVSATLDSVQAFMEMNGW